MDVSDGLKRCESSKSDGKMHKELYRLHIPVSYPNVPDCMSNKSSFYDILWSVIVAIYSTGKCIKRL